MNLQTGEVPTVQPNPSESLMSRMGRRAIQIAPRLAVAVGLTLAADSALLAPVAHADQLVSASGYDVDVYCNYVDNLTEIDIDKTQGSAAIEAAGTLTVGSEVIPLGHVTSGVLQHFKIPTQHDNETITLDITTPQKVHTSFQSGCRINDTKPVPKKSGYWLSSNDGGIYPFGTAPQLGPGKRGTIKVEKTPSGYGYYTLTPDGRVMGHGDAPLYGDRPALQPGETITTMSSTPSGKGYILFSNRGGVFAYGDGKYKGDLKKYQLNGAIVDSVPTKSGGGYWMLGKDGGVFSFGDAKFAGSMGATGVSSEAIDMDPDPDGDGYRIVGKDGAVYAFHASENGSMVGRRLNKPIIGVNSTPSGKGYWLIASDGGVFSFGDAAFSGSTGANPPRSPVLSMAAVPTDQK